MGKEWGQTKKDKLPDIKYNKHFDEEDVPSPPSHHHGATKKHWELHLQELQNILPKLKYDENIAIAKKRIKNAKARLKKYESN